MARRLGLLCVALLVACQAVPADSDPVRSTRQLVAHSDDLADHMPPRLAIMLAMAWFGLPSGEPGNAIADPSYGNWDWSSPSCGGIASNASACADFHSSFQRNIASRGRPLAGIYSSSGRTEESLRRIDLMLSTTRRSCDEGARLDAFAVQLNGLRNTSLHPENTEQIGAELPYQALLGFFERADALGLQNAVMPAMDATW